MIKIDGTILKQMIISGANNLYNCYPEVDALNVFPVPDGDTGTNMNLTISSGSKEVANSNETSVYEVARSFSRGLLMGARGNSGVILSQIFRGFAEGLKGKKEATAQDIADALQVGKEVAYRAVMRPVEGTILTVIRESASYLLESVYDEMPIDEAFDMLLSEARQSLERTPNLLPVLKEAGVVDSGGAGFCKILEGFSSALHNRIVEKNLPEIMDHQAPSNVQANLEHEEFGYCTEFILRLPANPAEVKKRNFVQNRFQAFLSSHGNSIVLVQDEDIIKVHIHTLNPGNVLTYAQQYGEFVKLKIENMSEQHSELMKEADQKEEPKEEPKEEHQEPKEFGLISVGVGQGIVDLFKDLNCDYVVSGGQTMNPSTEDFVKAIKSVNAKNIFILPNNSNIVMAAAQACEVVDGVNASVIPSKTIPQGLVAAMMFNPSTDYHTNVDEMTRALDTVKTGQITFAIKDTSVDGVNIHKDDFIGIVGKQIVTSCTDKIEASKSLVDKIVDPMTSIITVLVGEDVSKEEEEAFTAYLQEKYGSGIDIDVKHGGQPVYSFILGIE